MNPLIFKIIGALGLVCIIGAILIKPSKAQSYLYIAGGILLEAYSIYIGDTVFIVLQGVFIVAALWRLCKD